MSEQYDPNVRDDWEEEKLALCTPENMGGGTVYLPTALAARISPADHCRLSRKLELVQTSARQLGAAMVKGTLKYKKDDFSVDEWFRYMIDDASDTVNYIRLAMDAYEREQKGSDFLGPFDGQWKAWEEVLPDEAFNTEYYTEVLNEQLREFDGHEALGQKRKADNELVDIASIAINWLRCRGLDKRQIASLIRDRIATRHAGKAQEIREKYRGYE